MAASGQPELGTAAYMFAPLPRFDEDMMVARTVAPLYLLSKLGAGDTPIRPFFFTSQYGPSKFSGGEHNLWDDEAGVPAPRPALVAFSTMTHFLEDAKLLGDIYASSKSGWALHFVKKDGTSIVVVIPERRPLGEFTPATADESERQQSVMRLPAADFDAYDFLGRKIGQKEADQLRMPMQTWEARYLVSKLPVEKVRETLTKAKFEGLPALLVNPRSFDAPLGTHPKLRVKVENLLPRATDAHLEITAPKEITLTTSTADLKDMKPGEIRFVEFPVTSATSNEINRYRVQFHATAGGITQDGDQVVQVACATYGTPKIDGDLSDWKDAIPVTMVARGGKDWREIALNPDKAADLLAQKLPEERRSIACGPSGTRRTSTSPRRFRTPSSTARNPTMATSLRRKTCPTCMTACSSPSIASTAIPMTWCAGIRSTRKRSARTSTTNFPPRRSATAFPNWTV
ncbi:COG1470 family protein [Chthoniobacter flavus]|uniref:COG1470 family protein n=1 Tax=Chthoniobacter flavus TaxID=191863 RepID=UPI0012FC2DBE|nr:hypothetical protein [Chthoniobacter flavus]